MLQRVATHLKMHAKAHGVCRLTTDIQVLQPGRMHMRARKGRGHLCPIGSTIRAVLAAGVGRAPRLRRVVRIAEAIVGLQEATARMLTAKFHALCHAPRTHRTTSSAFQDIRSLMPSSSEGVHNVVAAASAARAGTGMCQSATREKRFSTAVM